MTRTNLTSRVSHIRPENAHLGKVASGNHLTADNDEPEPLSESECEAIDAAMDEFKKRGYDARWQYQADLLQRKMRPELYRMPSEGR